HPDTQQCRCGLPTTPPPPVSLPGSLPGKTSSPLAVFAAEYARLAAATCGAVRQSSVSPALHCSFATSNEQVRGSLMRPSVTPSRASHAFRAARLIIASFVAGIAALESFTTGTATDRSHACRWV